jgi:hypothetical protein
MFNLFLFCLLMLILMFIKILYVKRNLLKKLSNLNPSENTEDILFNSSSEHIKD